MDQKMVLTMLNRSLKASIGAEVLFQNRHRKSNCGTSMTLGFVRYNRNQFAEGDKTSGEELARSLTRPMINDL
jgi:hypothetical protein